MSGDPRHARLKAPGFAHTQSRISVANCATNVSISSAVFGRPGHGWGVPSYLRAISFRCQTNNVSVWSACDY